MEPFNSVFMRVSKIIEKLKGAKYKNIIMVSHSGLLTTLLSEMYNIPDCMISGGNCSISFHTYNGDRFKMISEPNNDHLKLS
jgi:broad specificity phosphatase PhoE